MSRNQCASLWMLRNGLAVLFAAMLLALPLVRPARGATSALGSVSANALADGADPVIGISDVGRLIVDGGSIVLSDDAIVGDLVNGIGLVSVSGFATGNPSEWETGSLIIGDAGTATMEIFDGGIVSVDFFESPGNEDLIIGNATGSVGTIFVNGLGSFLEMGNDTVIGLNGTGLLRIENEAMVVATNDALTGTDIVTVGQRGRVELDNGRLRSEVINNNGVIIGHGRVDNEASLINFATGHIEAGGGDRLVVNSFVTNQGEIAVVGGELEFPKAVTSTTAGAEVTLRGGGAITFPDAGFGYDSTAGTLASVEGVNDIYGTVRLQGATSKIVVAGESTAVFHDLVTNSGGAIDVFPGSSVVYLGGLTTTGGGSLLSIHLDDPEGDRGAGQLEVNGVAALAGNLVVNLGAGFVPSAGDAFQIVSAGSVTGSLALGSAPPLAGGMQWEIDVNATNVLLSVVATGDFNANGEVDAADYVLWRNSVGQTGAGLAADASGNGVVDAADYDFWRARFGNVIAAAGGGAAVAAVPESGAITVVGIGVLVVLGCIRDLSWRHRHAEL